MRRLGLAALLVMALARPAGARVVAVSPQSEADTGSAPSLRARLGVNAARTLTSSSRTADRLRGLERLRATGTPRAALELARAVSPGGSATTPEERLTAVRQLAWFTGEVGARRALGFVLGGHLTSEDAVPALDVLAEGTAAMALARSATPDAQSILGKALAVQGRAATHASTALLAYPPRDLAALLKTVPLPTVTLATFLGDLGDQRALPALRDLVRRGTTQVRAAAAVSLTRLGDFEALELAKKWNAAGAPAVLRVAAARILVASGDGGAEAAVAALLGADETQEEGLALARLTPRPSLVPALSKLFTEGPRQRTELAIALVGQCGGADAIRLLERALETPELRSVSAESLARSPDPRAETALARALTRPTSRRAAVRAAAARWYLEEREVRGLRHAIAVMLRSEDAADRAVAAQAAGLTAPERIWPLLWSTDSPTRNAAAGLLGAAEPAVLAGIASRLPGSDPSDAMALASSAARRYASTAALVKLADARDSTSPLAIAALAARDEGRQRPSIDAFLASPVPGVRASAVIGLAESPEPGATGRLESAYRLEAIPAVRAAIVRALTQRPRAATSRTLALAAALDPDAEVRQAARVGERGTRLPAEVRGKTLLWVRTPSLPKDEKERSAPPSSWIVALPSGLALPVTPDPEGELLVPGIPEGASVVRVAPEHEPDDASKRGQIGSEKSAPRDRPGAH